MTDDQLHHILGAVDDPVDVPNQFAEHLWGDIRATYEQGDAPQLLTVDRAPTSDHSSSRRFVFVAAAAAAVFAAVVGVGLLRAGDEPEVGVANPVPNACEELERSELPTLASLSVTATPADSDQLVQLKQALDRFRAEIDAVAPESLDRALAFVADRIGQAQLELDVGDIDRARASLQSASNDLVAIRAESHGIGDLSCLGQIG